MSILIDRSWETLRELRIGLSKSYASELPRMTVGPEYDKLKSSDLSYYVEGGVLGLLMSQIYDCCKVSRPSKLTDSDSVDIPKNLELVKDKEQDVESNVLDPSLILPFAGLSVSDGMDTLLAASIKLPESPDMEEASPFATESFPTNLQASVDVAIPPAPELRPTLFGAVPTEEPQKQQHSSDLVQDSTASKGPGKRSPYCSS